jgi:hypothetical protein
MREMQHTCYTARCASHIKTATSKQHLYRSNYPQYIWLNSDTSYFNKCGFQQYYHGAAKCPKFACSRCKVGFDDLLSAIELAFDYVGFAKNQFRLDCQSPHATWIKAKTVLFCVSN